MARDLPGWCGRSPEQLRARLAEMAAANGGVLGPDAPFQVVFGRLLPVILIFLVLLSLAGLLFQGAGWFSVVRRANREFAPLGQGARFAVSRLAALAGWSLAAGLLVAVVVGLPLLPGVLAESSPVVLLVSGVAAWTGPGLIASVVQGLVTIPVLVFQLVVAVVTFAELRGREDGTRTGGLAAELVGRPLNGVDGEPTVAAVPGRRWRGL